MRGYALPREIRGGGSTDPRQLEILVTSGEEVWVPSQVRVQRPPLSLPGVRATALLPTQLLVMIVMETSTRVSASR